MKNIETQVVKNILTIKIDLSKRFGASKSGKTVIVASSEGNVSIKGAEHVKMGVNLYVPASESESSEE